MKTPGFWYQSPGFFSTLLWPLGWLYGWVGKIIFHMKQPQRFQIPIISIGNIVCGGAGKTPTAIGLMYLLIERGHKVHFVTRGYGGKEQGPLAVDPSCHKSMDVGDEPLLLAQHAPTWVAKKRSAGVQKAIENGAEIIILDDGHQTTSLYKDVSLVVIDQLQGFGNECVMPAGPLREDLSEGLKRADGFIGIGTTSVAEFRKAQQGLSLSKFWDDATALVGRFTQVSKDNKPLFNAQMISRPLTFSSNRVVAFCGLGFPQKFYRSLTNAGLEIIATETFPDHYQYTEDDLFRLRKLSQKHNGVLITTRKDLVKIPFPWQVQLHVLDITIEFEDPDKVCDFILQKIYPSVGRT